jgi:hypothetical protein
MLAVAVITTLWGRCTSVEAAVVLAAREEQRHQADMVRQGRGRYPSSTVSHTQLEVDIALALQEQLILVTAQVLRYPILDPGYLEALAS